jgi:hypothetical protein
MLTECIQMEQILQYLILSYTRAVNLTDLLCFDCRFWLSQIPSPRLLIETSFFLLFLINSKFFYVFGIFYLCERVDYSDGVLAANFVIRRSLQNKSLRRMYLSIFSSLYLFSVTFF